MIDNFFLKNEIHKTVGADKVSNHLRLSLSSFDHGGYGFEEDGGNFLFIKILITVLESWLSD